MASILKVKDKNGNIIEIPAIQGSPGKDGLTTQVKVGSTVYSQADGLITLPEFVDQTAVNNSIQSQAIGRIGALETSIVSLHTNSHAHANLTTLNNADTIFAKASDVQTLMNDSHTHGNKDVLDKISEFEGALTYDNTLVSHTHSNSTVLDKISDNNGIVMYDGSPIGKSLIKSKYITNDWADGVIIVNNYGNDIIFMMTEPLGDNTKIIDISIKYDNVDYSYLELVDNQILSGNASLYISRKSILNEAWGYYTVAMLSNVDSNSPIFQDMTIEGGLTQGFTVYYEEVEYVENN